MHIVVTVLAFALLVLSGQAFRHVVSRRSSLTSAKKTTTISTRFMPFTPLQVTKDTFGGGFDEKEPPDNDVFGSIEGKIGVAGVVSNVICDYSLYVLRTTSCGLPPGPLGLLGAAEGISYLVVVGLFAWSLVTKITTGSGLKAGPAGMLGAAEGLTFLTVLAGIAIGVTNMFDYGFLPGFLPNDRCFGIND